MGAWGTGRRGSSKGAVRNDAGGVGHGAKDFYSISFACHFSLFKHFAAAAKSLQSCPTLCDPIDSSPPGSPVPGILQARTLEWVAISFSSA